MTDTPTRVRFYRSPTWHRLTEFAPHPDLVGSRVPHTVCGALPKIDTDWRGAKMLAGNAWSGSSWETFDGHPNKGPRSHPDTRACRHCWTEHHPDDQGALLDD